MEKEICRKNIKLKINVFEDLKNKQKSSNATKYFKATPKNSIEKVTNIEKTFIIEELKSF